MVRAILKDRKTQTRRIVKPQPFHGEIIDGQLVDEGAVSECPFEVGMELWVRETHYWDRYEKLPKDKPADFPMDFYYRADGECCEQIPECQCGLKLKTQWRPSIFMPRWASRITLEIVEVRVERLQDISDGDCLAEGISTSKERGLGSGGFKDYHSPAGHFNEYGFCEPCNSYRTLWESINGDGSWKLNPWVWVIEFKKL